MTSPDSKASTKLILILLGTCALLIGGFVFLRCRLDVSGLSYCSTLGLVNPGAYKNGDKPDAIITATSGIILLFKDKIDENTFSEVTIIEDNFHKGLRRFTLAERMEYRNRPDNPGWVLINGKVLTVGDDGMTTAVDFRRYVPRFDSSVPFIKIRQ